MRTVHCCIGTYAHGCKVMSIFSQSDVIVCYCISAYSDSSEVYFKIKSMVDKKKNTLFV